MSCITGYAYVSFMRLITTDLADAFLEFWVGQAKMVYVASLNDQMVPIYSGIFAAANHPRILRALYIDGDAYQ